MTDLVSKIKSKDIDKAKVTNEKMLKLQALFPNVDVETLARYLIARNNKVKKASILLSIAENWRAQHWPVLKDECINEINKGKFYVRGVDKEGRPILVFRARMHNPKDRDPEEMAKAAVWFCEQAIKNLPEDKTKYTILIDRTDGGNSQDPEFVKFFAKLFQDAYPERVSKIVVFPTNVVFWGLWNIVKWFLDPVTRNKVSLNMYFNGVQEHIADEHIPIAMGGKDTYEFNSGDFTEPYSPELIEKTLAWREGREPATKGSFFNPEQLHATVEAEGDEDEDEDA